MVFSEGLLYFNFFDSFAGMEIHDGNMLFFGTPGNKYISGTEGTEAEYGMRGEIILLFFESGSDWPDKAFHNRQILQNNQHSGILHFLFPSLRKYRR